MLCEIAYSMNILNIFIDARILLLYIRNSKNRDITIKTVKAGTV